MATELETMIVAFEASTAKFTKSVEKMNRDFNRQMGLSEKRAKQAQTSINASLSKIGTGIGGFGKTAAGGVLAGIIGKFSISGIEQAVAKLAEIGDVAQRVNITTDSLQKLRYVVEQTGGTAEDADNAIQKFAKELGTQGSTLQKVFQQAGVEFRKMTVDQALLAFLDIIDRTSSATEKLAKSAAGFGREGGKTMVLAAEGGSKEFRRLGDEAVRAGNVIDSGLIKKIQPLDDEIVKLKSAIDGLGNSLIAEFAGPLLKAAMQDLLSFLRETAALPARIKANVDAIKSSGYLEFTQQGTYGAGVKALKSAGYRGTTPPSNEQLSEYYRAAGLPSPLPTSVTIAKKPGGGPVGGGIDTSTATQSAYEKEVESIQEKIEALRTEQATIGMTTAAAAEYTARQELINAATAEGKTLTEAQTIAINDYARNIGTATAALEKAKSQFEAMNEAQKAFASEMSGAMEGLIVDGKSLNEVFADILDNLARMLIQAAIAGTGPLAGLLGTASMTGGAGGLAGLLAGSLQGGGPVKSGHAYLVGEKGPEVFVPRMAGQVVPNEHLRAVGGGGGGAITVSMPVNINAPGADPQQLMRVQAEVAGLKQSMPQQMRAAMGAVQNRRLRV